jgi:hypothetical protein
MRFFSLVVTGALASGLGGCTIYTYQQPPPPPPRQHAHPTPAPPPRNGALPVRVNPAVTPTVAPPVASSTPPTRPITRPDPGPTKITAPTIFGNGTGGPFTGTVFVIPENSAKLPDLATLTPFAQLFTDRFDIKQQEFAGGFPGTLKQEDWFAIRYTGSFKAPVDLAGNFKMTSDDGAVLYIDNIKVVDNDGVHTTKTTTSDAVVLKQGEHQLRLEYFQAKKGLVALQVFITVKGTDIPIIGGDGMSSLDHANGK